MCCSPGWFAETDAKLLADIVCLLGLTDAAVFDLRRQDREGFPHRLDRRALVIVSAV